MFLHASSIDTSNAIVDTIDGYFIRGEPHNWAMLKMGIVSGDIIPFSEASPHDPCWRDGRGEMSIRDSGQGAEKKRVEDVFV